MTWEIVVGIIALIGVFGSVGTWSIKLGKTLAILDTTITALKETITTIRNENKTSHDRMYKKIDDHEVRITKLEEHEKVKSNGKNGMA